MDIDHPGAGQRPDPGYEPAGRVLRRRRALPGSRAVTGALMVTVALVATWWAAHPRGSTGSARYVVASHPIAPGQRLAAPDLALATVDLPAGLRAHAFEDPRPLLGRVARSALDAGDLVQASGVADDAGRLPARELSFVIDPDWAVGGTLRAGDRIDVLATYGDGESSQTTRVLTNITVRRVADAGGHGLGASSAQAITVAITDPHQVQAAVNAARAGTITVVRSTTADPARAGTPSPYRPPGAVGDAAPSDRPGTTTTTTTR